MELNVTIDKEAVEQQVIRAITESAIGDKINGAINNALNKPDRYGADTLLEDAVKQEVMGAIRGTIANTLRNNEEFKERVRKIVEDETTDDVLRVIITKLFTFDP